MPICPFQNKECYAECALYAPGIQGCCFVATTLLLEDIQRVSVLAYEKYLQPEGAPLRPVPDSKTRMEQPLPQERKSS